MHKVDLVPRESVTSCSARQRSVGSTERRLSSRLGVSFKLRVILTQKPPPLRQNVPRGPSQFQVTSPSVPQSTYRCAPRASPGEESHRRASRHGRFGYPTWIPTPSELDPGV